MSISKTRIDQNCEETVPLTCYFAQGSAPQDLCRNPRFSGKTDRVAQRSAAILAVGPAGTLPTDYVGFPTLPGLPPASPIYIPQTGGFEIT
jgi:hypothetical protein